VIKGGADTYELPATERDSPRHCRIGLLSMPVVKKNLRLGKLVCIVFHFPDRSLRLDATRICQKS
jgi:hypothetical protein